MYAPPLSPRPPSEDEGSQHEDDPEPEQEKRDFGKMSQVEKEFNRAMKRLSVYISKYHSGIESQFYNMDKDSSGSLTSKELKEGFQELGVGHLSDETWDIVIHTIDDNNSGSIELPELLDTFKRWSKGGWMAVEQKHGADKRKSAVARQEYFWSESCHTSWGRPDLTELQGNSRRRRRYAYGDKIQKKRAQRPLQSMSTEAAGGRNIFVGAVPLGTRALPGTRAQGARSLRPQSARTSRITEPVIKGGLRFEGFEGDQQGSGWLTPRGHSPGAAGARTPRASRGLLSPTPSAGAQRRYSQRLTKGLSAGRPKTAREWWS